MSDEIWQYISLFNLFVFIVRPAGGAEGLAFIKTNGSMYRKYRVSVEIRPSILFLTCYSSNVSADDYPDIELVIGAGGVSGDLSGTMRNMVGLTEQFYQKVYKGLMGKVFVSKSTN